MSLITNNYPVNYNIVPPLNGSSGSIDTDPNFIKLEDAAWEAIKEFQSSPTDLNTEAMMQAVNNLSAYLAKNPPTSQDPQATAILAALNTVVDPLANLSLAGVCSEYDQSNVKNAVLAIQGNSGWFSGLFSILGNAPSSFSDQGNATVASDMNELDGDLMQYNWYMALPKSKQDPKQLAALLANIGSLITQLNTDAKGVTDGYLTSFLSLLNTPISVSGGPTTTLLQAAANPASLEAALNYLGENSGNSGGSLRAYLELAIQQEGY